MIREIASVKAFMTGKISSCHGKNTTLVPLRFVETVTVIVDQRYRNMYFLTNDTYFLMDFGVINKVSHIFFFFFGTHS